MNTQEWTFFENVDRIRDFRNFEPKSFFFWKCWPKSIFSKFWNLVEIFSKMLCGAGSRENIATEQWSAKWADHAVDKWFHLVAIWQRIEGLSLYINGCLVGNMTSPMVLGSANNARYSAVILDEFYIYEYALPSNASTSVYWNYFLDWKFVLPTCHAHDERPVVLYVIWWFWIIL